MYKFIIVVVNIIIINRDDNFHPCTGNPARTAPIRGRGIFPREDGDGGVNPPVVKSETGSIPPSLRRLSNYTLYIYFWFPATQTTDQPPHRTSSTVIVPVLLHCCCSWVELKFLFVHLIELKFLPKFFFVFIFLPTSVLV